MATTTELLVPAEVADELRTNTRTLERWRFEGNGPAFVKVGRRVAYRRADLESWLETRTRKNTAEDR